MDLLSPQYEMLKRRVRDAVLSRAARLPGIAVGLVENAIVREVRELRSDVDAVLAYIEALPDQAKKAAAYEFFASFFTHYLPKKFLRRYIYGHGSPPSLVLSEQEMIDTNPYVNVASCRAFIDILGKMGTGNGPISKPLQFNCPASALTNGTLGQFTVKMEGTLVYRAGNDWVLSGKMSFYDEWDFDPKDFSTGGRSLQGELKTRFAHYTLPGEGFTIESEKVDFKQSSSDGTIVWKGGTPGLAPDRMAELDMEIKKRE